MAGNLVTVHADTREVQKALDRGVKAALLANNRALGITGRKGAVLTARRIAQALSVNQRAVRKRCKHFLAGPLDDRVLRLWVGLHNPLRPSEAGRKASAALSARTFQATMPSGHTGDYIRKPPGKRWSRNRPRTSTPNLPIEEPRIRLDPPGERILRAVADEVGKGVYPQELAKDFRKRITKAFQSKRR